MSSRRKGRNLHPKFPAVEKLKTMLQTERDCGDRVCFLSFQVVENCVIFSKTDRHPFCQVPCDTRDCSVEIVHNVMCPTWHCTMKPTTPLPPTPSPSQGSFCSTPSCIAAASSCGILAILAVVFLILIWKKTSLANRLRARLSLYERLDEESTPIFRPRHATVHRPNEMRASWSVSNPNAVGFENVLLNDPGEAETRF